MPVKFEATAGDLSATLGAAALALDDKSNVAALAMVRLLAQDRVFFTVDALDRRVTVNIAATIAEEGEVACRCTALVGVLGGLDPGRNVTIESNGTNVIVRAGRSRFTITGLAVAILPESARLVGPAVSFGLDTDQLRRMLEVCEHAISTEETRYYLNGLYFHIADKMLRGVATDGHRLAWLDLPLPAGADAMSGVIVPGKIIALLGKLLKKKPAPETVSLRLSDRLLEVSLPSLVLTAKVIDATYPDYIRIVPAASGAAVTVGTDNLRQALARIEALFDEKIKHGMRVVGLSWSDGALHVSLTNTDESDDVIEGVEITGDGRFAARVSYLVDVLEAFGGKKVTLDVNGPSNPAIRITDSDDAAAFAIVMRYEPASFSEEQT
jgi:DNA polymerase III subunit beta